MRALIIVILALLIAAPTAAARPIVTISDACTAEIEETDENGEVITFEVLRVTVQWSGQGPVAAETRLSIRFRGGRLVRSTVRLPPFERPAEDSGSYRQDIRPFPPLAPWWRYQDITLVDVSGLESKGTPKRSGPWPGC